MAILKLKIKKGNKTVTRSSFDINKLKDMDTKIMVQDELNQEIRYAMRTGNTGADVGRTTGITRHLEIPQP